MLFCVCLGSVRLLNTTVDPSIGTYLLLYTKVVFVGIGSKCLQAKCYSSLSILGNVESLCSVSGCGLWDLSLCSKTEELSALRGPLLVSYWGTCLYIQLVSREYFMQCLFCRGCQCAVRIHSFLSKLKERCFKWYISWQLCHICILMKQLLVIARFKHQAININVWDFLNVKQRYIDNTEAFLTCTQAHCERIVFSCTVYYFWRWSSDSSFFSEATIGVCL